jgi:hypothetical protein
MAEYCNYCVEDEMRTPIEERPGVWEVVPYFYCQLEEDFNLQCPYPARVCGYKDQREEFTNSIMKIAKDALDE